MNLPVHRKTNKKVMKKTELLHNFFLSVFIGNHLFFNASNLNRGTGGKKIGREDQVQDHMKNKAPNTDSGIECTLNNSAGHTKLSGAIDMLRGRDAMQRDLTGSGSGPTRTS